MFYNSNSAYQSEDYYYERNASDFMPRGMRQGSNKRPRDPNYVCWVDDYANASLKLDTVEDHHQQKLLERQMARFELQSTVNHQRQLELIRAKNY